MFLVFVHYKYLFFARNLILTYKNLVSYVQETGFISRLETIFLFGYIYLFDIQDDYLLWYLRNFFQYLDYI